MANCVKIGSQVFNLDNLVAIEKPKRKDSPSTRNIVAITADGNRLALGTRIAEEDARTIFDTICLLKNWRWSGNGEWIFNLDYVVTFWTDDTCVHVEALYTVYTRLPKDQLQDIELYLCRPVIDCTTSTSEAQPAVREGGEEK